jgi:protocatechuate 3,4-dioxygenase beta subunit
MIEDGGAEDCGWEKRAPQKAAATTANVRAFEGRGRIVADLKIGRYTIKSEELAA